MGVISDAARSRGDIMQENADLKRQVAALTTARRLEAASIGRGGITVRGGQIVILDEDGNESFVASTDGLALIGALDVLQGGNIVAHHPDDSQGVIIGLFRVGDNPELLDRGISVQTDDSVPAAGIFDNANIFAAWQRSDGLRRVHVGELGNPVEEFNCRADLIIAGCRTYDLSADGNAIIAADGDASVAAGGQVAINATGQATITASSQATIRGGGATGLVLGLNPPAGIGVIAQPSGLFLQTPDTTAAAANVNMDGSGRVAVVTSAARNKVDIEDLAIDPRQVLGLRPRTWRDRTEVEREPDTDRWHVGLVAEEVDQAGLTEFVDYDADGNPQSVSYDRLVVALLEVVREQQARLDALDGGVERRPAAGRKPKRRYSATAQPPPAAPLRQ